MDFRRWHLHCTHDFTVQRGGVMEHLVEAYGPMLLFLLIFLEPAGAPVPGETPLIAASLLASRGQRRIGFIIAVATTAAIAGDSAGYRFGPWAGRGLLRCGPP